MLQPTVIFCHGRESGPWGTKIRALAKIAEQFGCHVISRDDHDTQDPSKRISRLIAMKTRERDPVILVGSSMGGYVAAKASETIKPIGLFLMAPAIGLPGYGDPDPNPTAKHVTLIHGWDDPLISAETIFRYAMRHRLHLAVVAAGHSLTENLSDVEDHFTVFLHKCLDKTCNSKSKPGILASL